MSLNVETEILIHICAIGILARRKLFCTKEFLQNSKISICKLHKTFLHLAQMVGCVRLKLLLDLAQIVVCVRSKDYLLCANIISCKYPKDLCAVAHNLFCKQRQCFVVPSMSVCFDLEFLQSWKSQIFFLANCTNDFCKMHRKNLFVLPQKKRFAFCNKEMMMLRKKISWEKHFLHVAANKKEYLLKARLLLSACCKYFLLETYLTSGKLQESFNVFSTNSLLRKSLRHAGIPVAYIFCSKPSFHNLKTKSQHFFLKLTKFDFTWTVLV